ncbi:MAG: hypothetical protein ACRYF0_04095 [Janthinobacterium lividum]
MKNRLLPLLVLLPTLAQAYGGGGRTSAGEVFWFVTLLLTPFLLPPALLLWAYLRPQNRGLQLVQGLALVGFMWLWSFLRQDHSIQSMAGVSFYFQAFMPLALLLNGLAQARQATRWQTCLLWTGAAITGGYSLLTMLPLGNWAGWGILVNVLLSLGSWVLVLCLLRRVPGLSATLWQGPFWRTPALVSAVGGGWVLLTETLSTLYAPNISTPLSSMLYIMAFVAGIHLVAGLVALRLVSPLAAEPGEPELTEELG